ncbi:MAG: metallophosphoesterase [Phaeodactylibacter sp.]|nr:metallophosphoesterase [Phaeodactylibacter sp.]
MRIVPLILALSMSGLLVLSNACAQSNGSQLTYNDGPYIFYENGLAVARWISEGKLKADTLKKGTLLELDKGVSPSFDAAYLRPGGAFEVCRQTTFKDVEKIAAISDIHGQYDVFFRLLQANRLIDDGGNWAFGQGHLVIVGDVFDRGEEVTEILWLINKLEQQAEMAGGKVHYLLGNHEIMALQGDLRYINKKYRYTSASLQRPYNEIFGPDSYLGRWLRTKPIAISINKIAFVHAGYSEQYLQLGFSEEALNKAFRERILDKPEDAIMADPVLRILYGESGPVWYRGYFKDGFDQAQARSILKQARMKHIVVGHTSFSAIRTLFRNRIIGIDSSIKFGKSGEILLYENKHFYRGTISGEKLPLN